MTQTIGEQLHNARLERQLSLDSAAQALHIRRKYLEALENGQVDLLPSRVQGKGFLRMYADYLGLPVQPLLDLWDGKQPAPPPPASPPPAPPEPAPEPVETVPLSQYPAEPQVDEPTQEIQPVDEWTEPQPTEEPLPPSSKQVFMDIGLELAERRQLLNLSLEEVERFTHVRRHYLKALETGHLEELPSPVQGRGMLNNYAHFLNLDAEQLLNRFAEGLQHRRVEKLPATAQADAKKQALKRASPLRQWSRFLTPDLVIVGSVIIGLVIFAIWSASEVTARQKENIQATPPSIAEVLLSASPQKPLQSATPSLAPNIGTRQPEQTNAAPRPVTTLALTGTVPVTGSGQVQIYVVANQRTYLRITADNRIIFDERLVPGNAYAFAANQRLEVLISNAAGVRLFFNQQDLGILGVVGEVKSLVFTREGVITPTVAASPTPSRTPSPSITPRTSPTGPTLTITPFIP